MTGAAPRLTRGPRFTRIGPNPNDRAASSMLAAKVGALRHGAKLYRATVDDLDEEKLRRSARSVGRDLDAELETFYEARVGTLLDRLGGDLREPKRDPTLRFMRGDAEKWMAQSAANGSFALTQQHARTVARSGANAAHNAAVLAIARANRDQISGVMALATLDNRTTELCQGRHGGAWDLQTGNPLPWSATMERFPGRPPYHWNCRTTLTPIFAFEEIPQLQEAELDEWFESDDAKESLGAARIAQFQLGFLTRTQLITGERP